MTEFVKPELLSHIPGHIRDSLGQLVERVLEFKPVIGNIKVDVRKIVLFGSLANGNWKSESSDIDVAIVMANSYPFYYEHIDAGKITPLQINLMSYSVHGVKDHELRKRIKIAVCTESDLDGILAKIDDGRGILSEAIKKGIPLYDKQSVI